MASKYGPLGKCQHGKSMVSLYEKDNYRVDEGKAKMRKADTHQNQKRHIPHESLLLLHEKLAVYCFVSPLVLQLWGLAGREVDQKSGIGNLKKTFF